MLGADPLAAGQFPFVIPNEIGYNGEHVRRSGMGVEGKDKQKALEAGMAEKSAEFLAQGAQVYRQE